MDRPDSGKNKTPEETESGNSDLLSAIDGAIIAMQELLKTKGTGSGSVTDLVRLLQLRKELEGDRSRHVSARWIDDECKTLNTLND